MRPPREAAKEMVDSTSVVVRGLPTQDDFNHVTDYLASAYGRLVERQFRGRDMNPRHTGPSTFGVIRFGHPDKARAAMTHVFGKTKFPYLKLENFPPLWSKAMPPQDAFQEEAAMSSKSSYGVTPGQRGTSSGYSATRPPGVPQQVRESFPSNGMNTRPDSRGLAYGSRQPISSNAEVTSGISSFGMGGSHSKPTSLEAAGVPQKPMILADTATSHGGHLPIQRPTPSTSASTLFLPGKQKPKTGHPFPQHPLPSLLSMTTASKPSTTQIKGSTLDDQDKFIIKWFQQDHDPE